MELRPKLDKYLSAALISVFGKYFDVTNHVASNQADSYVAQFKAAFGNIEYL